jgi:hypothetical protein
MVLVTCSLCRSEIILVLGDPYLSNLWPLGWEEAFLGLGLESAWGGLSLNKHWSENSTSETPVRINGTLL